MKKQYLITLIMLVMCSILVRSQVKFDISFDKAEDAYVVSIIPEVSYTLPDNLTGTAQISIKAPTGQFNPVDIKSMYPGIKWEFNSRTDAPEEAPDFDYVSFGLKNSGLLHLPYREGVKIPLMSFKNEFGCICPIALVKNEHDPFMPPNSHSVNIGNSIAIVGYGINAYNGVQGDGMVDCKTTFTHDVAGIIDRFDLYPIPTEKELFLEFNWSGKNTVVRTEIVDQLGRVMQAGWADFKSGHNLIPFDVSELAAATYFLKVKGEGWEETLDKFIKVRL